MHASGDTARVITALLLVATALPPGTVVVGVSTIDGTNTDVVAVAPSGEREVLTSLEHARGRIPKGDLLRDDDVLETVSAVDDGAGSVLEWTDLSTGQRRILDAGPLAAQAPHAGRTVHQTGATRFEIVSGADHAHAIAFAGTWLSAVSGSSSLWLAADVDGAERIVAAHAPELRPVFDLGHERARSPVATTGHGVILERELDAAHAELVDAETHAVVWRGLPGMDPRPLDGDRIVFGAGTKHGAVVIARVDHGKLVDVVTLDSGMPGAATPLAAELVNGRAVVVAWLNRGAAFPGALVELTQTDRSDRATDTNLLATPTAGAAYEVYGVTR